MWCFCRCFLWTTLIYGESLSGNLPQISPQGSRTVLKCGTSRRCNRESVYTLSQRKDRTELLENSLNVSPCVFFQVEFTLLDTPAVGTSGTTYFRTIPWGTKLNLGWMNPTQQSHLVPPGKPGWNHTPITLLLRSKPFLCVCKRSRRLILSSKLLSRMADTGRSIPWFVLVFFLHY